MRLESYTLGLLIRRDDAPELRTEQEAALQDAHMAHLADLHDQGVLLAAGPVPGAPDRTVRGFAIYAVDIAAAHEVADRDPAVQAGCYRHEFHPWLVPAGIVHFDPGHLPRSMAEVNA